MQIGAVIDNFDSFTYNLVQMLGLHSLDLRVFRCDSVDVGQLRDLAPDYIIIGPGPGNPEDAGVSREAIRAFHASTPVLGVCLGMQCINECFGGRTVRAPLPVHGKTSALRHCGTGIFAGLQDGIRVARYHSLVTEPSEDSPLRVTARSDDGVIMGLAHPRHPVHGVQFHPESFLTPQGGRMIENFLGLGGAPAGRGQREAPA